MVTHTTLRWSPWRGRTRPDPAQPVPVDRASPADLMQLATDVGPAPMHVGAVLILGTGPGFSVAEAQRLLGERIRAIPRLRQRLRRAPPGCGRPFWADDPAFDLRRHVRQLPCPPPGDERALLEVAAAVTGEPLPRSRALWSAAFVTGLAGGCTGLVIVMNHVLADGIGGLAVLARLVDESPGPPPGHPERARFPVPAPGARTLAADAWTGRARRLTHPASSVRTIRQGLAELGGARPPRRLPATSLNRPTGPQRRIDVIAADLAAVRDLGHAHGGTVNDVILAAIAGALRALLASRGEELDLVTVSVPVSARQVTTGGRLGNQVGVMPVALPVGGDLAARLTRIAAITRERKTAVRGSSAAVLGLPFRLLAPTGLLRWYVNRQRLVHTFATNLRGPAEPLKFAGAPVRAVIPIPATTGNVTVTFAALSYAGTLRITVVSDPSQMPDVTVLTAALRRELGSAAR
jgi:diacylglycerol O-acyltransferase / wax synthase